MVENYNLSRRWKFYKGFASKIKEGHFPPDEDVTYGSAARWIPSDPNAPFPAVPLSAEQDAERLVRSPPKTSAGKRAVRKKEPTEPIEPAAFGMWISDNKIPKERETHFEQVTGLSVAIWTGDDEGAFKRQVRRAAGELLGWRGLAQSLSIDGVIRVKLFDISEPGHRRPVRAAPNRKRPVQWVWPGCGARIELPMPVPGPRQSERRAWMFADYGHKVYVLDPTPAADGSHPSTRLDDADWRKVKGGFVTLPRGEKDYVEMPPEAPLGTQFDVLVLVMNLEKCAEEIRAQIDTLERDMLRLGDIDEMAYQHEVERILGDAALLVQQHDEITVHLYRQSCEVVAKLGAN